MRCLLIGSIGEGKRAKRTSQNAKVHLTKKGGKLKYICELCGFEIENVAKSDYPHYCPNCNSISSPLDKDDDGMHCNYCEKKIETDDYQECCPWCEHDLCSTFDTYAEIGNPDAQYIVAHYYLTHVFEDFDVEAKRKMAIRYMKKAAEQNYALAKRFLRKNFPEEANENNISPSQT